MSASLTPAPALSDPTTTMASEVAPLPAAVQGELDVLLIDNFDSFTWNLYQQICLQGARSVTVIRNDAITEDQLPLLKLNSLIISPGPGHPKTDGGISQAAIKYFAGKVPVMGVCMGLECLVDVFGGDIGCDLFLWMRGSCSSTKRISQICWRDYARKS